MLRNFFIYVIHSRVHTIARVQVLLVCSGVQADKYLLTFEGL